MTAARAGKDGASPYAAELAGFLAHLTAERRLSRLTAENYARDVRALLELVAATPLARLKTHHIRRFIGVLHGRGLKPRSLARMLSAWRGFFHYLVRDHGYAANPCMGVRAPKAPRNLPAALSPEEAARLLEFSGADPMTLRDKAMFELFYSSGLRLSELAGLDLGGVDFREGSVRVLGKGAKTRVVPLGREAARALEAWIDARAGIARGGEQALFLNRTGTRLSVRAVQNRLRLWAMRQGLATHVHPHMLRHSMASHVLQSSGDLRAVQEMLGHASISTTQVYTHLDFQHLAKVYDAAHPRARKKQK